MYFSQNKYIAVFPAFMLLSDAQCIKCTFFSYPFHKDYFFIELIYKKSTLCTSKYCEASNHARFSACIYNADNVFLKKYYTGRNEKEICKHADPELQCMYYHGHSWLDKSREDFRFCQRMWFWLGDHGQQTIENVFEHSALYRKTKGPHYVALTVRNAGKRWNGNYYGKKNA